MLPLFAAAPPRRIITIGKTGRPLRPTGAGGAALSSVIGFRSEGLLSAVNFTYIFKCSKLCYVTSTNLFVSSRAECVTKMQHNIKFGEITLYMHSTVVFSHRLVVCALAGCDSIVSDGGIVPGSRGDGFGQRRPHQTDNDAALLGAVNEGK